MWSMDPGLGYFMAVIMMVVYGLIIYAIVSVLLFMKRKLELDEQRNQQIEQLIRFIKKKE